MANTKAHLTVETLLAGEVKLASPPEVFLKLSEILDDPTKTLYDAERVIQHDPGLTARLLRLVNSAFYGFPRQIRSVSRAISLIGLRELRALVLATWVVERFSDLPNKLLDVRTFWRISVRLGLLAKALSRRDRQGEELELLFTCGLLHEIGRLVIYAKIPELARAAILLARAKDIDETEAERQTYGFDHYQLAAELVQRWRLPEVFVATLRWHESPLQAGVFVREASLVALASQLSMREIEGPGQLAESLPELTPLLTTLHLQPSSLIEAIAEVETQCEEIFSALFGS